MPKKNLNGIIVSDKMEKTAVVLVERIKKHSRYLKRYRTHKKYLVENPEGQYRTGDKVIIEECRPMSKLKRWRIVRKIS